MKPLCIFGAGGCAREAVLVARRMQLKVAAFIDIEEREPIDAIPVRPEAYFDPTLHSAHVALGRPHARKRIVERLLKAASVEFPTLVDPDALVLHPPSVVLGHGSLVCARCVLTRDVRVGSWSLLNIATRVGHDFRAGDFFTTAYGVNLSGHNCIGAHVMLGAGVCTRDGVAIEDDILVGAGGCVVTDLEEPGIYVGVPAKKLERKHG
jgi:sugar O-acyltransferase (sialic acid O-acetyltransferase NeuD family)